MKLRAKTLGHWPWLLAVLTLATLLPVRAQMMMDGLFSIHTPGASPLYILNEPGGKPPAPPTIQITSPTQDQRVTNSVFTFTGQASAYAGNVNVTSVNCFLNGTPMPAPSNNYDWSVVGNLIPGQNSFQAYAVDSYGFVSLTSYVQFTAVFFTPLTVLSKGIGNISPNENGAALEIGRNFSLTATTTAKGFVFTNWTAAPDIILTNNRTLTFTMQSNLVLTATFVDTQKPTLTITSPAVNLLTTNGSLLISGMASDNAAVSNVWYQVNSNGWLKPNGLTNWSVGVNLTPGTNIVQAYTVDPSGNVSPTNTIRFVYVSKSVLTVTNIGRGSESPNDNGASLQVGQNYTITAVPGPGFVFSNWFIPASENFGPFPVLIPPIFLTNRPTLTIAMSSNLVLAATFVDMQKPAVTITSPTPNLLTTNGTILIHGTASDNAAVSNVWYQVNGGGWLNPTGLTNWSVGVNLTPGTNTIQAYAVDTSGNVSPTNTMRFVYISKSVLTVTNIGRGSESPNDNGASLQLGQNYTITAIPGVGFTFSNWFIPARFNPDAVPAFTPCILLTNRPTLTFAMSSDLVLVATFVDTQKPSVTITSPLANQAISSDTFTIHGTASDNAAVSNVWYQFNGGGWLNPNGLTNWSVSVNLTPGTNIIQACAVDTSGNVSATNTVRFVKVDKILMVISILGNGTVTPNYNGAALQIGQNYTMTAMPAPGFGFASWGIVQTPSQFNYNITNELILTNGPTLIFPMVFGEILLTAPNTIRGVPPIAYWTAGVNLVATFTDIAPPTVTITAPAPNARISNEVYTVTGTAKDNAGVAGVSYQLNNAGWQSASTGNGWANWFTGSLPLS